MPKLKWKKVNGEYHCDSWVITSKTYERLNGRKTYKLHHTDFQYASLDYGTIADAKEAVNNKAIILHAEMTYLENKRETEAVQKHVASVHQYGYRVARKYLAAIDVALLWFDRAPLWWPHKNNDRDQLEKDRMRILKCAIGRLHECVRENTHELFALPSVYISVGNRHDNVSLHTGLNTRDKPEGRVEIHATIQPCAGQGIADVNYHLVIATQIRDLMGYMHGAEYPTTHINLPTLEECLKKTVITHGEEKSHEETVAN